ncbi:MAG: hypothetical protein ABIP75_20085 [Pyrinomonadaceae bacterium]
MGRSRVLLAILAIAVAGVAIAWSASSTTSANRGQNPPIGIDPPEGRMPDRAYQGDFEVEVLVNGYPRETYFGRGRRYVEAVEGQEYSLRIRNPLGIRVAVALSVDGLNTIDARRTSAEGAAKWVIEPYSSITISGWQVSGSRARQFYFTTERNSYGAKIGQTANLGVISAVFFRERRAVPIYRPPSVSRDEQSERRSSDAPTAGRDNNAAKSRTGSTYPMPDDESAATGIGRNQQHEVTWVNLDLESRPTAEVTMRYEYRESLVRLGILPRYSPPDTLGRRERASGFDGHTYSPEP